MEYSASKTLRVPPLTVRGHAYGGIPTRWCDERLALTAPPIVTYSINPHVSISKSPRKQI